MKSKRLFVLIAAVALASLAHADLPKDAVLLNSTQTNFSYSVLIKNQDGTTSKVKRDVLVGNLEYKLNGKCFRESAKPNHIYDKNGVDTIEIDSPEIITTTVEFTCPAVKVANMRVLDSVLTKYTHGAGMDAKQVMLGHVVYADERGTCFRETRSLITEVDTYALDYAKLGNPDVSVAVVSVVCPTRG